MYFKINRGRKRPKDRRGNEIVSDIMWVNVCEKNTGD